MSIAAIQKPYIEKRDKGYWIAGSRVSLESVVFAFQDGFSPETIATECFPSLNLESVYGAITYFLAHQAELKPYLREHVQDFQALRKQTHDTDPDFVARLNRHRRQVTPNL